MPFRVVLDSDGLIKLAKAGLLESVVTAWTCLIPRAVYVETVERGVEAAFPDALLIQQALSPTAAHPAARHPRAAALLARTRGLGQGEQDSLHLFFAARADAIVTDDAAFVRLLARAGVRYLVPALVPLQLVSERCLEPSAALDSLGRMRPFIRPEVYRAARADLETLRARHLRRHRGGAVE